MHNTAKNICVQVFIWTHIYDSLGYILKRGISGSCGNSMVSILTIVKSYLKWLHHFTFLPAIHESSHFSTSLQAFVIVHLSHYSHCNGAKWYFSCFWFAFYQLLMISNSLKPSNHVLTGNLYIFVEDNLNPLPIF